MRLFSAMLKFGVVRVILIALGALSLINAVAFIFVANINIGSTIQIVISICIIAYAFLLKKIAKAIHITIVIICLIPMLFALFLMIYGNMGNPDYKEDAVIVLGAGLRGERVTAPLALRLNTALEYLRKNPYATVIVCGGLGDDAIITEAEAMERYLISYGTPLNRIIREDRSRNTYESLTFAKEILDDYFPSGHKSVLITSDFHLFRTDYIASHVGIPANRAGASTPLISLPANCLRELLAVARVLIFPPW